MAYYQQQPFYNPKIPFTGSIQGGLQDGKSIIISGRVLPGANRFHVNFKCGSDIALHFNPRYDNWTGYIVTNTNQNSRWGTEERICKPLFPIGHQFTLHFLVSQDSYKISVNGNHIMEYRHRIPFSNVDAIAVDGMVEINSIAFQNPAPSFPQPGFPGAVPAYLGFQPQYAIPSGCAAPPSFPAQPSYSVPYKSIISGGLLPGKNIYIQGVVMPNAHRFSFNLRHRSGIAFHYNPRFDENLVVRNTLAIDKWGSEERSGGMPFHKGQPFQVVISCGPHQYSVFVNGMQVHTYNHRFTKLHETDILEISGDLSLTFVQA
ncbi:galectin-9-like isoform X1 [Electrophorus electricus]|uniref:Galectin n=1 Tax=Electrophorus electricus TaxID=8005 RepID=A0A4W4FL14_ELEEL|nr:galectin-9-like isoform X1 [Electrophorus electricus]